MVQCGAARGTTGEVVGHIFLFILLQVKSKWGSGGV